MRKFLLLASIIIPAIVNAADPEVYYYASNNRPCEEEDAIIKLELSDIEKNLKNLNIYGLSKNGWQLHLRKEIKLSDRNNMKITVYRDRTIVDRYKRTYKELPFSCYSFTEKRKRQVIREGTSCSLLPLNMEGAEKRYYGDGRIQSVSYYSNNQLISNQNWLTTGRRTVDSVFYSVDVAPVYQQIVQDFHGYIRSYISSSRIPVADLDGTIRVRFVVMEDGTLEGANLISGLREDMDQVVMGAVKTLPGGWEPALLDEKKVRCFVTFPVNFHLGAKGRRINKPELPGGVLFWR